MVDLLNFSFWSELDKENQSSPSSERFCIEYNKNRYSGYWSLCAAINRGIKICVHVCDVWKRELFRNYNQDYHCYNEQLCDCQSFKRWNSDNNSVVLHV